MDDGFVKRNIALIQSMTKKERANPQLLRASRKKRVAKGAGLDVTDLNKLLKQHRQTAEMMKKAGKMGAAGALGQAMGGLPGMGPGMTGAAGMEAMRKQLGALPGGLPGMPEAGKSE